MYEKALDEALKKIELNIERFDGLFPLVTNNTENYELNANEEWTSGFWVGLLWLASEASTKEIYVEAAKSYTDQMIERLDNKENIEHHDIGFLYTLSTGAGWEILNDEKYKQKTIQAADHLMKRYREKMGIIQAWGPKDDKEQGGMIIVDCLMNMPLLFWATETTGEKRYEEVAISFIEKARKYLVRGDDSSYHTFFFNQETGEPERGGTAQGYSESSTWTRGQAWAIYGFALAYKYTKNEKYLETSLRTAKYFIENLPENLVAHWDFDAPLKDIKPDSSASAIAACGFHELLNYLDEDSEDYKELDRVFTKSMETMVSDYATEEGAEGLLDHGSYNVNGGRSTDDFVIWGDYFYFEALMRITHNHKSYW